MTSITELDLRTPVIIGVGQVAERLEDADYQGLSPIDLAVSAARAAVADTGATEEAVIEAIDVVAATRQFENSTPAASAPLGKSTKFPLSVANRIGAVPRRAVLDVSGGQSPQHLVTEFASEILDGHTDVVLLVGGEAISTTRDLATSHGKPDFSDDPPDPRKTFEDRGFGLKGLIVREQIAHGLAGMPAQYALLENARRAARKESRQSYAQSMGALFAPFTKFAAANPFSAAPEERSAEQSITLTDRNRMIAEPLSAVLGRPRSGQSGASVLLTSIGTARRLGIDSSKWVFLHGHADLRERDLLDRPALSEAPSAVTAVQHALDVAELTLDDDRFLRLLLVFPHRGLQHHRGAETCSR